MCLWSHGFRYASSAPLTDRAVLCFFHVSCAMLRWTDDTVDTLQDESWSAVMWIWFGPVQSHSAPLSWKKPSLPHREYMHAERAWSQLIHSFPILHSLSQYEQSPCCYETFVHGIWKNNPRANGRPCGREGWLWKPVGPAAVCSIKFKLMKRSISFSRSPRQSSGFKAYVGQSVGRKYI